MTEDNKRIIVALDFPDEQSTLAILDKLDPELCRVKVGKELFTRSGPQLVRKIIDQGYEVFLDLKFHDIPNTVAGAIRAAAELGVWMVNVHASGGANMMQAARLALSGYSRPPLLIAVTVLTSMGEEDLEQVGILSNPLQQVLRLANLAADCGLDGIVCSANETQQLRTLVPSEFLLVTPGIRPAGDSAGDQKRVETPAMAISKGSSYLVIGRPITQAEDPTAKLNSIQEEIFSK
ncbi:MAG: orotidine-5'-phosphate decarboxylase [Pseudohongiellaceae bacterium]